MVVFGSSLPVLTFSQAGGGDSGLYPSPIAQSRSKLLRIRSFHDSATTPEYIRAVAEPITTPLPNLKPHSREGLNLVAAAGIEPATSGL